MISRSDPRSEREKAAYGPRSLKKPGSVEWCWQTLNGLVDDYKSIDERFNEVGVALAELKAAKAWKVIPTDRPYGSEGRMLAEELGVDARAIRQAITEARKRRDLQAYGGKREGAGRPKKGESRENQGDNITLKSERGTSRAYILARLDRDGFRELAIKVRAGEMSASKAAVQAGFSKKLTRVEQAQRLVKAMTNPELRAFKKWINDF
jgi:hypothetical protein